jgi:hypothetical protein
MNIIAYICQDTKSIMTMNKFTKLVLIAIAIVSMTSCEKGYLGFAGFVASGGASNKQYYKGKIPCSFYRRNWEDELATQVTGIPWMVIEYDRTNDRITDFEFGLSGVTQSYINSPAVAEPTLDGSSLDCYNKLDLENPVVLLVNWPVTAWGGTVTNGSLNAGGPIFYYDDGDTKYTFSRITDQITGGAENLSGFGIETATMMDFDMFKE